MVEGPDVSKPDETVQIKADVPKKKSKEDKQPTKVVIRRLPGSMTEESFLEHISPLFENDYFYYIQGENPSLGESSFSRAYINFLNVEDVFTFTQKFDDYVFIDNKGQEYPAVVEFAPFQRIPKYRSNRKHDSLSGTIEDDPDYKEFVNQIESEDHDHKPNQITEHYFDLASAENAEKVTTTPLIEFLTSKRNDWLKYKEEKKEERRRRDVERKKGKEESRRSKKEAQKTALPFEKLKLEEDKKKDRDIRTEDAKSTSSARTKGKSYQEERQRDLARRKRDDKPLGSGDMRENNSSDGDKNLDRISGEEAGVKAEETKPDRGDKNEDDHKKKGEEKRVHRDDDKGYSYSKDREEKKVYYGQKKRDYANGYEYDSKYKNSKRDTQYYEDYKTRSQSSYQKNNFSVKYNSSKTKDYEDKGIKRFENKKKFKDYKDLKKSSSERDTRSSESKDDKKPLTEPKMVEKDRGKGVEEKPSKSTDHYMEYEPKNKEAGGDDDKKDNRSERRIKNKDRPAMEIYRPGMGKFSRQRLERNKSEDSKEGD